MATNAELNLPIVRALVKTGGEIAVADHIGRLRKERDELRRILQDIVNQWEGAEWCDEAARALCETNKDCDPPTRLELPKARAQGFDQMFFKLRDVLEDNK